MSPTSSRPRLVLGLLAAAITVLLAVPSMSAADTHCGGHLSKTDQEESLGYSFGCTTPILGYSIVFDQPISGFDTEVPVLDSTKSATSELFSCEGGFPSYGMSCFGSYTHPGNQPTGNVGLDRDACVDPRYKAWLTVVINAKGQARGPFPLKGPFGCETHTSPIKRLMAWIAQLQAEKKKG